MGQDYKECWLSAWPVIGKAFEEASAGQTRFLENQRMFLDRYGYLEETFFTFSFNFESTTEFWFELVEFSKLELILTFWRLFSSQHVSFTGSALA